MINKEKQELKELIREFVREELQQEREGQDASSRIS